MPAAVEVWSVALGIGMTAVATLFPVAMLRSINATRLTKGTIHRHNAETWVDLRTRQLVHNPDGIGNGRQHFDKNYIVDPFGWEMIRGETPGTAAQKLAAANQFGLLTGLPRYNGINRGTAAMRTAQFDLANRMCVSPDSWVPQFEQDITVRAFAASSATLGGVSAADLGEVTIGNPPSRITLFDSDLRTSHTRTISSISAGNRVNWTSGGAMPAGFVPASAMIEAQERQFTWLLTIRNRGQINIPRDVLKANVDVVVFFRRQFSKKNERVFDLTGVGGRDYRVDARANTPSLKKGGFLCDVVNARWYRIQQIQNQTSAAPVIRLETAPPAGETLTKAVFVPGVVEVYSLGTKQ